MDNNFYECLKIEEEFYNKYFRQILINKGYDLIYVRYSDTNIIHNEIQKKKDIDVILDNREFNVTLSLKTVRKNYENIFFETISNCNTNSQGWGYYSKADYIIYTMGYPENMIIYKIRLIDILKLDIEKYRKGYGKTYKNNELIYKTEGRLIPLDEFEHKVINV